MSDNKTDNKTRIFSAVYRDKTGKEHHLIVRLNPRLFISLFLAFNLVVAASSCRVLNKKIENASSRNKEVNDFQDEDLKAIEEIIRNHPEMLYHIETVYHTTVNGDTLWDIAEKYNADADDINAIVKRIKEKNKDVLGPNGILPVGATLKVESSVPLDGPDKKIRMLESYISDYVLKNSKIAKIANGDSNDPIKNSFSTLLYGDKTDEYEHPGIKFLYENGYSKYHVYDNVAGYQPTDEAKQNYIVLLEFIIDEIQNGVNNLGNPEAVIPYSKFEMYCLNRSTKLNDEQKQID